MKTYKFRESKRSGKPEITYSIEAESLERAAISLLNTLCVWFDGTWDEENGYMPAPPRGGDHDN